MPNLPTRQLRSGDAMPIVGVGTFGSDTYSPAQVAAGVELAVDIGFRHFDCASVYGNEREVGNALHDSGVARSELWVTSKVWNDRHGDVVGSCEQSLRDLRLDYLDLYLVHWPFPNHHGPGVGVGSRDPHAVSYDHDRYMSTWRQMETLVQRGLARNIGTSNMTVSKLQGLIADASIQPMANELELHPHFQQPELFNFLVEHGIQPIGYSPIGSPSRPERDRTPEDTCDTEDPVVQRIAEDHGIHPAVVCVKWQVQRGAVPIPFSVKQPQLEGIFEGVLGAPLTFEEMEALGQIDRKCRLIKGQVFLWPGAKDWTALWDES